MASSKDGPTTGPLLSNSVKCRPAAYRRFKMIQDCTRPGSAHGRSTFYRFLSTKMRPGSINKLTKSNISSGCDLWYADRRRIRRFREVMIESRWRISKNKGSQEAWIEDNFWKTFSSVKINGIRRTESCCTKVATCPKDQGSRIPLLRTEFLFFFFLFLSQWAPREGNTPDGYPRSTLQ